MRRYAGVLFSRYFLFSVYYIAQCCALTLTMSAILFFCDAFSRRGHAKCSEHKCHDWHGWVGNWREMGNGKWRRLWTSPLRQSDGLELCGWRTAEWVAVSCNLVQSFRAIRPSARQSIHSSFPAFVTHSLIEYLSWLPKELSYSRRNSMILVSHLLCVGLIKSLFCLKLINFRELFAFAFDFDFIEILIDSVLASAYVL